MFEDLSFDTEPCPHCSIHNSGVLDKKDRVAMECMARDDCLREIKQERRKNNAGRKKAKIDVEAIKQVAEVRYEAYIF